MDTGSDIHGFSHQHVEKVMNIVHDYTRLALLLFVWEVKKLTQDFDYKCLK